jgi:hypothetical protein
VERQPPQLQRAWSCSQTPPKRGRGGGQRPFSDPTHTRKWKFTELKYGKSIISRFLIEISSKISRFQQRFLEISPRSVRDFYECRTPRLAYCTGMMLQPSKIASLSIYKPFSVDIICSKRVVERKQCSTVFSDYIFYFKSTEGPKVGKM